MAGLSRRQSQALRYIVESVTTRGFPPTIQELCHALGCRSTNAVHQLVRALERKGYVRRGERGKARNLQLTEKALGGMTVHRAAHGRAIPWLRSGVVLDLQQLFRLPQGYLLVDPALFPEDELFAATASDDGLSAEGILSGDILLARRSSELEPGRRVVAWVDGILFARILQRLDSGWELRATVRQIRPIRFEPSEPGVAILGYIVGVLRRVGEAERGQPQG